MTTFKFNFNYKFLFWQNNVVNSDRLNNYVWDTDTMDLNQLIYIILELEITKTQLLLLLCPTFSLE